MCWFSRYGLADEAADERCVSVRCHYYGALREKYFRSMIRVRVSHRLDCGVYSSTSISKRLADPIHVNIRRAYPTTQSMHKSTPRYINNLHSEKVLLIGYRGKGYYYHTAVYSTNLPLYIRDACTLIFNQTVPCISAQSHTRYWHIHVVNKRNTSIRKQPSLLAIFSVSLDRNHRSRTHHVLNVPSYN